MMRFYAPLKAGFPIRPDRLIGGFLGLSLLVLLVTATQEKASYRIAVGVCVGATIGMWIRNRLWFIRRWPLRWLLIWLMAMAAFSLVAGGQFLETGHLDAWGIWAYSTLIPLLGFAMAAASRCFSAKLAGWAVVLTALVHAGFGYSQVAQAFDRKHKDLPHGLTSWHTHFGELLVIAITLVTAWVVAKPKARWHVGGLVCLVIFPVLIYSSSRTAFAGVVLGPLVVVAFGMRRHVKRALLAGCLAVGALVAIGVAMIARAPEGFGRYRKFDQMLERGVSSRQEAWNRSWSLITDRPVMGHGLNMDAYFDGTRLTRSHNVYLEAWMAGGLPTALIALGLTLYGLWGWWLARRGDRVLSAAGLAIGLVLAFSSLFNHSMFDDPLFMTYWAAWVGLGVGYAVKDMGAARQMWVIPPSRTTIEGEH